MQVDHLTDAFARLRQEGCSIESEDWTEADTRSKFIDTILIDCLGWTEADIRRERSSDGLRLDYLLSVTRPVLVLEAKRAAFDFKVISAHSPRRVSISSFLRANPAMKEPLGQVATYSWNWSAPYAALTNGKTYLVFQGTRIDGTPWHEGQLLVLADVFDETFNFADLQRLLARDSVSAGHLTAHLLGPPARPSPDNVLSKHPERNATIPRNPLGLALEPLLRQVFSDVSKDDSPEVLEHCYVYPGETRLRDEEFEALLLDRPPAFAPDAVAISSLNVFKRFQDTLKDYLARSDWAQTILVIGGIGVGKTMFLRRFFALPVRDEAIRRDTCALFIDFRKPGLDPASIPHLIYDRLYSQIVELDDKPVAGHPEGSKYDLISAQGLDPDQA